MNLFASGVIRLGCTGADEWGKPPGCENMGLTPGRYQLGFGAIIITDRTQWECRGAVCREEAGSSKTEGRGPRIEPGRGSQRRDVAQTWTWSLRGAGTLGCDLPSPAVAY